ncbi:hypothetical protein Val02_48730 [Virgisporangium aliadipatigenens]|uniref:WD40 repeat domain-containing protein n=1 Tax=Virgisporangium aliadipatigenens TaxID=741659 RepID=A0A8J3YP46_9ACTN|nr:hypothetical protein [Virgisporangium aliadipatigenens]GIJ47987.1 hypothetical protein Val02_48730 [Virgisporangium aliadipatigenens]
MSADGRSIATVLAAVADEARPARLPADLWSRGMRRRRRRQVTAALAALALALPLLLVSRPGPETPADGRPAVPSRIDSPFPFVGTATSSPPGGASVIVTGPGGFGASGLFGGGYEDRAIVVGTNGSYRTVRHLNGFDAGESVLLSPDGRRVAGDWGMESSWQEGLGAAATTVLDLTTGHLRRYGAGAPVAWFPDGTRLLTSAGTLRVLHLDTGAVDDLGLRHETANVALAPDGRHAVVQDGSSLTVLDLTTGQTRTMATLDERHTLAGPGAWDGHGRVAVWECTPACSGVPQVALTLTYIDADTGAPATGPALRLAGVAGARLLGWQRDGDAVAVRFRDSGTSFTPPTGRRADVTAPPGGQPEVVALRPDGPGTVLVRVPAGADRVEVARGFLDRFGAAPASLRERLLDWLASHTGALVLLMAAGAALYAVRRYRRRNA